MSSGEPFWYCHGCQAEMRPLMTPDPICASCHGSFVEKMEDPTNDPRQFAHSMPEDLEGDGVPPGMDAFLLDLQALVDRGLAGPPRSPRFSSNNGGPGHGLMFQIRTGSGQRVDAGSDHIPTMSEFGRRGPDTTGGSPIAGPLMAQYLMALLGNRDPLNEFFGRGSGSLGSGRMGDYVFNQEALDHIITQLMENSNAHRPVPATEQIMSNLQREVLEHGSPLLEKDCAVCKEQFKLETEDPDEQVVVTLPCMHPFHEPCIIPWLKSSGTCPVCRHALIPQPEYQPPPTTSNPDSDSDRRRDHSSRNRSPRQSPSGNDSNSVLQSIFGGFVGGSDFGRNNGSSSRHSRSNSDPASRPSGRRSDSRNQFPGGWNEDLD